MIDNLKGWIKHFLGAAIFLSGMHRNMAAGRAVIVAFHTVGSDDNDRGISISQPDFVSYCRFFARYYNVGSLSELLERLKSGRDVSRCLAITFDDGYLDNHEIAAKELEKLNLPATFFVVTDFIGSDSTAWWDQEDGLQSEWMNWEQVEDLNARGFEIASHTKSHIDMEVVSVETAKTELESSKALLEQKLDREVSAFAYPYGGRGQIRPETRLAVSEAGFSCCLSCFGGIVEQSSDPMYLRRAVVNNWYVSPYHFGFEVLKMRNDNYAYEHDNETAPE